MVSDLSIFILMVRSFIRLVSENRDGAPCIDVPVAVEEQKNAPLHRRVGRQMIPPAEPWGANRQGPPFKTFRQTLGRAAGRRPLRVPGMQPCQHRPLGGQALNVTEPQVHHDCISARQPPGRPYLTAWGLIGVLGVLFVH
jgi:hypothetical protein